MIAKSYRCELTAVAFAALLALAGTQAQALSLGRITVQSALGEPLRAEIDIPEITAEEAATLKAQVATPATFQSAGMDYSPVLPGLRMVLQKRPDGRAYLRVTGDRPVQEPFVDLMLEANWSTGRLVRDYTLLFDPPVQRAAAQPIATPLVTPRVAQLPRSAPVPTAPVAVSQPAAKPAPVVARSTAQQVTVRPGQTASKIALTHKPADVSLDQMLVAMQQTNPKAFIDGNVNRIKAGAILALPTAEQARATTPVQASQIITAQSRDFNRFRQELAANVPVVSGAPAERNISGTIEATVQDKTSAAQTPDKLTLSKGAVQSASDLDQLALKRDAEATASRAAEVAKNTADLNELARTATALAASGVASANVTESMTPSLPAPPSVDPASAPDGQKPAAVAVAAPPVTVPGPGSSFLDELIANPLLPAGAAALVLLLAGLGFYKVRQRQKKVLEDSSFMESGMQPESFFGANGGQKVDTSEGEVPSSMMAYSPSLLDAEKDADPLAEADVYLAYGRDGQAEGILKDALRAQPGRLALHQKLLSIYAKRQDVKAYAALATLARPLTDSSGSQWTQICKTGLTLDPGNALYLTGGQPAGPQSAPLPVLSPAAPLADKSEPGPAEATSPQDDSAVDLDLDLDFSDDQLADVAPQTERTSGMMAFDMDSLSLDLGESNASSADLPDISGADPLESKLALAEEFKASGDDDGARDLIKQVIAEADGAIKAKAQQALSQL